MRCVKNLFKLIRYGEKISYRTVPKIVTVHVKQCCDGYTKTTNDTCIRKFYQRIISFLHKNS